MTHLFPTGAGVPTVPLRLRTSNIQHKRGFYDQPIA